MPSRLSSLLVRDGLVGVKRMEKAFQRQVIYGGSLDTILLEMGLVPEERLTQYLALASGLPPASRDEGTLVDPVALATVSRELAEQHRAVPVAFEGDAIRILVCAPLELTELEDFADLLDRPLQPLITPEYRWHLVYAGAYGLDPPARFTTLARALDVDPASTPVGRAPTIIVDERSSPPPIPVQPYGSAARLAPVPPDAETLKLLASMEPRRPSAALPAGVPRPSSGVEPLPGPLHDDGGRARRHTIIGVAPNRAATDSGPATIRTLTAGGLGLGDLAGPGPEASDGTVMAHRSDDDTPPSGIARRSRTRQGMRPSPSDEIAAVAPPADAAAGAPSRGSGVIPAVPASGPAGASGSASGVIPAVRSTSTSGSIPAVRSASTSGSIPAVRSAASTSGVIPAIPAASATATPASGPASIPASGGTARSPSDRLPSMRPLGPAPRPTPIPTLGRDSALPIVRAREVLATAEDRDTVFLTLLRAARSRARWAGLLTVQGGAAIGRVALAEPGLDATAINTVLIPLDAVSPFRTVVGNHQSHIGPLVSGDPSIDSMILRMGGTMPPSALILPIVLRDRVVALLVAHRVNSDLKLVDVTELLPMANAASEAIGRLIVKHKAAGYRAPVDPPVVEIDTEMIDTKRISRSEAGWRSPTGPASVPGFEQGVEMSMEAGEPRPIDDLLGEIERAAENAAQEAIAEAVERAPEAVRALTRRFPGKLRVDRFAVTGRALRAAQYGGLLELVIRLGAAAADLLIDRMAAPQRDVRFYATVCAAELRPRTAVFALAERLFDQDFGVRAAAVEALTGYPPADLGHALQRARRAVHSTDPDVIAAASGALVALDDIESIPDLIGVIERSDRGGEHARRALTALTAQDFGASERKWRKWYDTARRRHRIEWLIEGLLHKEDAIRENAINVLRRMTGEYFGYHHDLPRKERDAAAERWSLWWRDAGHRRFAADAERQVSSPPGPARS